LTFFFFVYELVSSYILDPKPMRYFIEYVVSMLLFTLTDYASLYQTLYWNNRSIKA